MELYYYYYTRPVYIYGAGAVRYSSGDGTVGCEVDVCSADWCQKNAEAHTMSKDFLCVCVYMPSSYIYTSLTRAHTIKDGPSTGGPPSSLSSEKIATTRSDEVGESRGTPSAVRGRVEPRNWPKECKLDWLFLTVYIYRAVNIYNNSAAH